MPNIASFLWQIYVIYLRGRVLRVVLVMDDIQQKIGTFL